MQELDLEGLFWRPEAPDREIAGRLPFDPTAGAILSFIEPLRFSRTENTRMSLTDLLGAQSEDKDGIRFLGVAGPHKFTLDQCRLFGSSLQSNRFIQRRYQVTSPPLYQEQRYFNAVVAAETLIRIRKKEQDVNLKKGLQELAGEVDAVFAPLVGDLTAWAQEVVRTRDNFVVHPGLRGNSDGYRLYLLSESIYLLVVLRLLRDCSVAIDSLKNIQNHEHFKWLAAELVTSAC